MLPQLHPLWNLRNLLYVAVSRARDQAHLYTDGLTAAIGLRDGAQAAALDHELDRDAGIEIG